MTSTHRAPKSLTSAGVRALEAHVRGQSLLRTWNAMLAPGTGRACSDARRWLLDLSEEDQDLLLDASGAEMLRLTGVRPD